MLQTKGQKTTILIILDVNWGDSKGVYFSAALSSREVSLRKKGVLNTWSIGFQEVITKIGLFLLDNLFCHLFSERTRYVPMILNLGGIRPTTNYFVIF